MRVTRRLVLAGAGVLLAAAVATGVVLWPSSSSGPSPASVAAWEKAAASALTPLGVQEPVLAQQEYQWDSGSTPTPTFRAQLAKSESVMVSAYTAVARLPVYPGQPEVDRMYAASTALDVVVPEIQESAIGLPAGALRSQVMAISDRVRELADRTFDQGRVLTAQGLVPAGLPAGSDVELPLEVPDWTAEGLAAGPPLAPMPPAPDRYPPLRQVPRPSEYARAWKAFVTSRVPSASTVANAVATGSTGAAAAVAAALQAAVTAIGAQPDPRVTDGREVSDRLRLALLVEAEAARLRQAETLGGTGLAQPAAQLLAAAGTIGAGIS